VTGDGPLDTPNPRANAVYCSNKCRQKAYRQRQGARYGKKLNERMSVTKVENVTEATLETLRNRNNGNSEIVCAWCDVYNRVECVAYDDKGHEIMREARCAYCGRGELGRKWGRQTPIPPPPPPASSDDGVPF